MSAILKPLSAEAGCNSTPNAFANNRLVRILETGTGNALITRKDSTNTTTIATFTIRQGTELIIEKDATDNLTANTATVVGVPVAYKN